MGSPANRTLRGMIVTKAELGTKRLCPNCGAKYYDLNKDPILCPRCGAEFEGPAAKARPQARTAVAEEEEPEVAEAAAPAAEFVSLEEADEETAESGAVKIELGDDEEIEGEEEADDTFLADDEDEEGDDVTDIIGDVDEDET